MFTGLVTAIGEVTGMLAVGGGHDARITIETPPGWLDATHQGASIACAGCCLTAIDLAPPHFTVEASRETLSLTTIGRWRAGTRINLERSLRVGDELGGHLVSGHVDGLGVLVSSRPDEGSHRLIFSASATLMPLVARKGSIAIDGVSLTVNAVEGETFSVNIIPHTSAATTLGVIAPDDPVHLEVDMLARYVARLVETGALTGPSHPDAR